MRSWKPAPPGGARTRTWIVASLACALVGAAASPQAQASKRTSGVRLQAEVPQKLRAGEATTLVLQVSGVTAPDGASLEVRRAGHRDVLYATRLQRGERRTIELPFVPSEDGVQYVDVFTRQGDHRSVQSVAIPVGSGRAARKPDGTQRTTPQGEGIVSLPARSVP